MKKEAFGKRLQENKEDYCSPKRNIKEIHAMLMALSKEEQKGLLALQKGKVVEEKKDEDF